MCRVIFCASRRVFFLLNVDLLHLREARPPPSAHLHSTHNILIKIERKKGKHANYKKKNKGFKKERARQRLTLSPSFFFNSPLSFPPSKFFLSFLSLSYWGFFALSAQKKGGFPIDETLSLLCRWFPG